MRMRAALSPLLNAIFPPACHVCSQAVAQNGALCSECWKHMRFLGEPCCARCGLFFDVPLERGAVCGECMREPPPYALARAVFEYNDTSKTLVLNLKYHDATELAPNLGRWMASAASPFLPACHVVLPVPLFWQRQLKRRYNQSLLLGHALAKQAQLPFLPDTLRRIRHTAPQTGLSRRQRQENMNRAFAVPEKAKARLRQQNVLLVDDVYTTGATINACTHTLLEAGARDVYVITLARRA